MSMKELCRIPSSSSSIPSSPVSPFSPLPDQRPKTMEEVWKDINLSSLHDHDPRATTFSGMTFQDFLARPFTINHPISAISAPNFSSVPPPATMLTLNSAQQLHFLENSDPLENNPLLQNQPIHRISQHGLPFDPAVSAPGLIPNGKKRFPESDHSNSRDRRHKKMIKNRESAARSRARKQAYTNELELELAHLLEENAKLKKQQQLCLGVAVKQPKKKLSRSASF